MGGYNFGCFIPEAGVRNLYIWQNTYRNNQNIKLPNRHDNIFTGIVGIKMVKEFKIDNNILLVPQVKISGLYDLKQSENYIYGISENKTALIEQDKMSKSAAEINVGIELRKAFLGQAYLGYYGQIRNNYAFHSFLLNFQYDL